MSATAVFQKASSQKFLPYLIHSLVPNLLFLRQAPARKRPDVNWFSQSPHPTLHLHQEIKIFSQLPSLRKTHPPIPPHPDPLPLQTIHRKHTVSTFPPPMRTLHLLSRRLHDIAIIRRKRNVLETSSSRIWLGEQRVDVRFDEGLGWLLTAGAVVFVVVELLGGLATAVFEAVLADLTDYLGFFEGALEGGMSVFMLR